MEVFATNSTLSVVVEDPRVRASMWVGGSLGVVGFIMNTVVWLTFNQAENQSASIVLYKFLAIFDNLSILMDGIMEMFVPVAFGYDLFSNITSVAYCKLAKYLDLVTNLTAFYMVVALCLDKMVSVRFPNWYRLRNSEKHGYLYSGIVLAFGMIVESPFLYLSVVIDGGCVFRSQALMTDEQMNVYLTTWNLTTLHSIVPICLIVTFSALFWKHLPKSSSDNKSGERSAAQARRDDFEQGMKRMLISLIATFLILTGGAVTVFGFDYGEENGFYHNSAESLLILQHSLNLILYMLSGPAFRGLCWKALTCANNGRPTVSTTTKHTA